MSERPHHQLPSGDPGMNERPRRSLQSAILLYLLLVMILSGFLSIAFYTTMFMFGVLPGFFLSRTTGPFSVILMLIILTVLFFSYFSRTRLAPVNDVINAMKTVSKGDFSVRLEPDDPSGDMNDLIYSFNNMAQELGSIELFRKDFINNFSHEFKTPIVSIRGFAKQLERDDLTEEQRREYISIIVTESERLANMSTNILLLSKLENQQIVTDKTVYRLDEQLRTCILLFEKQWTVKDIDLRLDLDEVDFYGNAETCSHIWINLIGNAIKFSREGGALDIRCSAEGSNAVVLIRDFGEGMSAETRTRIFEKFYQGDSAHATEGNGLGLALVKRIVDLCRGTIEVRSEQGVGTTFVVTLPNVIPAKHEKNLPKGLDKSTQSS